MTSKVKKPHFSDFEDHHYPDLMSKGRKSGPKFGQQFINKNRLYAWDPFLDHLRRFGIIFVRPRAQFWEPLAHFGIFLGAFWHVVPTFLTLYSMTGFWINSRPSGNLEDSILYSGR